MNTDKQAPFCPCLVRITCFRNGRRRGLGRLRTRQHSITSLLVASQLSSARHGHGHCSSPPPCHGTGPCRRPVECSLGLDAVVDWRSGGHCTESRLSIGHARIPRRDAGPLKGSHEALQEAALPTLGVLLSENVCTATALPGIGGTKKKIRKKNKENKEKERLHKKRESEIPLPNGIPNSNLERASEKVKGKALV
jgi:hypothetical protein